MGLDSFWEPSLRADGSECKEPKIKVNLCGGMFSGNGSGSFRGKVYDDVVAGITGTSLYEERIKNPGVRDMASALEAATYKEAKSYDKDITKQEWEDLVKMFKAYAEAGYNLCGWW